MSLQKKVVICTSVGGGVFGEDLMCSLKKRGVDCSLDYCIPLKEYWFGKSKKYPVFLRFQMYFYYPLSVFFKSLFSSSKIYIVTTNPFFAPLLVSMASRIRGHKVIQHIYDLYPDALVFGGGVDENGLVGRICGWITGKSLKCCDATVFLGETLKSYAENKYGKSQKSVVITVGTDGNIFEKKPELSSLKDDEDIVFLYSGHMGKLHTSHALSECIAKISKRGFPAKFLFHSKGPELEKMHVDMQEKGLLHDGQVVIGSPLPSQEWVKTMTDSHIAIVTMKSGAENVVMPSKTYSALCAGQAVLAIAPKGSDLAKTVIENECGWVVEPDDVDGLEKTVFEILNDRDQVQQKRVNAFTAGHGRYTMDKVAAEWVDILEKIDEE